MSLLEAPRGSKRTVPGRARSPCQEAGPPEQSSYGVCRGGVGAFCRPTYKCHIQLQGLGLGLAAASQSSPTGTGQALLWPLEVARGFSFGSPLPHPFTPSSPQDPSPPQTLEFLHPLT